MKRIEIYQEVTYLETLVLDRDRVVELLKEHDPEANFDNVTDEDLVVIFAATLNDYPNSELQGYCVDNAVGGDILDTTDWKAEWVNW